MSKTTATTTEPSGTPPAVGGERAKAARVEATNSATPRPDAHGRSGRKRPSGRLQTVGLVLAGAWIAILLFCTIAVGLLPLPDPDSPVGPARLAPFSGEGPLFGTDAIGRDVLSRLVHGAQISVIVGLGAALIAVVFGTLLGLLSAYVRGPVEAFINVLVDAVLAFPPLLLLMSLASVITPGVGPLVISLGFLFAPAIARLARSTAVSQLQREYVVAARTLGASHVRILFKELLPNVIQPVISYAVVVVALLIVIEGSLSFLGVGVPPPAPSWGSMIAQGKDQLREAPYLIIAPSLMIFFTVFAFNTIGDWARRRTSGGK